MDAANTTASTVTLQSNDSVQFTVDRQVINLSGLLKQMLEDLPETSAADVIPVPECSGASLEKVLGWCERHRDDAAAAPEGDIDPRTLEIPDWDRDFLRVDAEELFLVTAAANYLEVKLLLEMCCKTIAGMLGGKSTEEMRAILGIVSDFTPEEEEQIRRENGWAYAGN